MFRPSRGPTQREAHGDGARLNVVDTRFTRVSRDAGETCRLAAAQPAECTGRELRSSALSTARVSLLVAAGEGCIIFNGWKQRYI